jgi:ankyrin repeat protein
MPNPVIFVPYSKAGKSGPFSLYTVICRENPASSYWNIREDDPLQNTDVLHKDIDNKVYNLQKYFKDEKGREFELALRQDGKSLARLTDSTPSVFLGLFICALVKIEKRRYCDTWESVTITGDVEIKDSDISLKPVGSIGEKYAGFSQEIQAYRENHPGKHLFLYVSDTTSPLEPCDGVEIKDFSSADSLKTVLEFLFSDKEQDRLFGCVDSSLQNWDYVQTDVFKQCKQEALLKNWKGFFIHGEGASGKSALAYALAKELKRDGCIYAPIWVSMDDYFKNINLSMASAAIDDTSNPLEQRNILIHNPISGYIAFQISKRLKLDKWTREQGVEPLRRAMGKCRYLLVIDNLELDKADLVLEAVYAIISYWDSKPPVILTSRSELEDAWHYRRLGLKSIETPYLNKDEVTTLVRNIACGESYEQKLKASEGTEEYQRFMEQLHEYFGSYPGMIAPGVSLLERKTVSELLPDLVSLSQKPFKEKVEAIYKIVFEQLDELTQAVLFAFIRAISFQDEDSLNQRIARRLQTSGWTLNGAAPEEWELEEEIPKSLDTLVRNHILNRTGEQKDGYAINYVPVVYFMFGEEWKSLQETLIETEIRIFFGLYSNQDAKLLQPLLERLKEEGKDISSFPFLHYAASKSKKPAHIGLLLTYGCGINSRNSEDKEKTPLHYAVDENQNKDIIKILISKGADINAGDKDGYTPLHYAVKHTNLAIITLLLKKNADIHAVDSWGNTPLHYAAVYNQNPAIIGFLIENGANINAKNIDGSTPLMIAARYNSNPRVFTMLIKTGSGLEDKDNGGRTSLHCATMNEHLSILKTLIGQGGDIHAVASAGQTLLHDAARFNPNPAIISFLIEKGLDISAKDRFDSTPLHCAAVNENLEILKTLIKQGGDIRAIDSAGQTLLHCAAWFNSNPAIIDFLIGKELDISAKDRFGATPLHYAARNEHLSILKTLIGQGGDIHTVASAGQTLLHYAAWFNSNPAIIDFLIGKGLDISAKDKIGATPLHYAARNKNPEILEALIKQGGDIRAVDSEGKTLLHLFS